MTPDQLFAVSGPIAMAGWLTLIAGIILNRPFLRDRIAGLYIPLALSAAYTVLILIFWWSAEGGFDTLSNVQKLFTQGWIALAGWVHYLAFDLLTGVWEVRDAAARNLPHRLVVPCLFLTFLFGPAGWLLYMAVRSLSSQGSGNGNR